MPIPSRWPAFESGGATGAVSASSVSGSARPWTPHGRTDVSTATGSRDPSASDENWNTRRRLDRDSDPDDEHARSVVLLLFSCEQCHAGMSAWLKETRAPADQPERVHCKRGTKSARIVFKTRAKCQELVERYKTRWLSVHNEGRLVDNLRHYGLFWKGSCKPFSLSMTVKVNLLFKPSISAPRYSTCLIAGTKLKCQFSDLPQLVLITVIAFLLMWLFLECPLTFCNSLTKRMLQPRMARSACDGRPFASLPFRRLASRGASFFCGALLLWPLWVAIFLHRRPTLKHHRRYYRKFCQIQCNNTYNTSACHLDTAILGTAKPFWRRSKPPVNQRSRTIKFILFALRHVGKWSLTASVGH